MRKGWAHIHWSLEEWEVILLKHKRSSGDLTGVMTSIRPLRLTYWNMNSLIQESIDGPIRECFPCI